MLSASRCGAALHHNRWSRPLAALFKLHTRFTCPAALSVHNPLLLCCRPPRYLSTSSASAPSTDSSPPLERPAMSAVRPFTASLHSVVPASTTPSLTSSPVTFSSLVFLGTGSAVPSTVRNTAALCVVLGNGSSILLDCGEGTQQQLMRCSSVKLGRIDAILITHLHGDHCFGLPGLLCTLGACGRTAPLTIVGPPALRSMVEAMLSGAGGFEAYPLHFLPIDEGAEHDCGLIAGVHVTAAPLLHTIPAFAYTLRESTRVGPLLIDRARALGVSGRELGKLKAGVDVTNEMGETVRAVDCVGPSPPPLRISLVQDTFDCTAAYSQLQGVDVLIHECTYEAALADKAIAHGHSTAAQAGRVAADVDARMLILTHFSARYGAGGRNRRELMKRHQQQAREHSEEDAEERKVDPAAAGSSSSAAAAGVTADELVQEAMDAYVQTKGSEAAACIPVCAAEDFLVFERHGAEFQLARYDRTTSRVSLVSTEVAG